MIDGQIPTTFLGLFAALMMSMMGLITWMVKATMSSQQKTTGIMDNHLSSVAKSLTLVEERLSKTDRTMENLIPVFFKMQGDIDVLKTALVQSTIVPPGTRVTVEPYSPQTPMNSVKVEPVK